MDPSGDGVAHHRGVRVFVPFSIPGEQLRVRVRQRRGRDAWASIEGIVSASPHRIRPRCQHFGPPDLCGGCAWQHIAYPEQLRLKTDLVRRLITASFAQAAGASKQATRTFGVEPAIPSTPGDDPWGYRHKVHFVFANSGRSGPLVMGHYVRGSRKVFMARECPVHDARGNAFAFALHEECTRAGVVAAPAGALRHVAVRCAAASRDTMATLVVANAADRRLREATRRALRRPDMPASFHLNVHDRDDPYIFGDETRHVSGPRHLREHVGGNAFVLSPTAFFQTNVRAAEILVQLVLDSLPAGKPVLDLYAGVGLFALPLARRGDRVVAIEESRAATRDGIASLALNRIPPDRCRFIARRVQAALRTVDAGSAPHVVLDPPRQGCEPGVIDDIFERVRPERAVYVSCNPEALAADLPRIVQLGYQVGRIQPVDMFPHTSHVETVAMLNRAHA